MITAGKCPGGLAAFPNGFFPALGCWCWAGKTQPWGQTAGTQREVLGRPQQREGCRTLYWEKENYEMRGGKKNPTSVFPAEYRVLPPFLPIPFLGFFRKKQTAATFSYLHLHTGGSPQIFWSCGCALLACPWSGCFMSQPQPDHPKDSKADTADMGDASTACSCRERFRLGHCMSYIS